MNELQQKEIYWIDKYSSTNPQIGYNIALGGNGAKVEHQTDETKRKISEANLGKKRTQEVREQMSKDRLDSRWINNGECNKLIRKKELSNYIYKGSPWKFGILPGRKYSPKSEEPRRCQAS